MKIRQTKSELANLAIRLFNNIDQAEQFDVNRLFYHCDKKFLLSLIKELVGTVQYNIDNKICDSVCCKSEELEEIFTEAHKALNII